MQLRGPWTWPPAHVTVAGYSISLFFKIYKDGLVNFEDFSYEESIVKNTKKYTYD